MNMITAFNPQQQTMSHREIASLTGKEPFHVKRDCDVMFKELELDPKGYIQNWRHPQNGQTYEEYMLPRDLVETLITGYSIKLRHAVLNRWRELEEQAAKSVIALPDFTNPAEAARAWAEQFEAKQLAEKQVAELAPKAEALDTIADTTGMYCLRECAKTIGIKESELIQLLIDKKWIYRDADRKLQPYAQYLLNGVFKNRTSPEITNKNTGERKVYLHMRVTAFGLTRITGLVNKWRKKHEVAA
ncbi:phage antirepressor KilAC domain-containing protein [Acinetobacter thermotolerans]|uniref:phage antirepressor KilAC domain-containing protein n=1 Tax=Acinetobacter thermotolerans TaxID=3151487 RepID=UPI00325BFA4F